MTIAILIPLLPLLAGLVISACGQRFTTFVPRIGIIATSSAFLLSALTLYEVSIGDAVHIILWPMQDNADALFKVGILIDRLTAVMMVLITGVSTVIHVYSVRYLEGDPGYARFYALLGLMTFVILSLVSYPTLFAVDAKAAMSRTCYFARVNSSLD